MKGKEMKHKVTIAIKKVSYKDYVFEIDVPEGGTFYCEQFINEAMKKAKNDDWSKEDGVLFYDGVSKEEIKDK